jgi:hypothetical protein
MDSLYRPSTVPVLEWRGEISLVAPKSIYIAAGLGIKKDKLSLFCPPFLI